jgi:predicted nucleotidyltransferase component of viral defense system
MIFTDLSKKERLEIFQIAHDTFGLSKISIEKDWWVTAVLHALFSLPYAEHLSFKGGTSLSKCWRLIERFSEDVDIAIIEVEYQSLFDEENYIKRKVLVEVSGHSMSEPLQAVMLQSMIDEAFLNEEFVEKPFEIQAVVPQRTFIEKICLLHEEFAKPQEFMQTERMSRHLYDLEKIMDTAIANEALSDKDLYNSVVEHRRIFIGLRGFDYATLAPKTINIVPPDHTIDLWKADYETMQRTMIYGESLPFNKLLDKIKQLNERVNQLEWEKP